MASGRRRRLVRTSAGLALLLLLWWDAARALQVTLAWDDPTNPPGTVTQYVVYRQDQCLGTFLAIGVVAAPTMVFTDANVLDGNTYCWQVTAMAATGEESAPSNTARLFLFQPAPPQNVRGALSK